MNKHSGDTGIKVGCCGFQVRRERYFATFPVVEVQATFYDLVEESLLEKWRAAAPHNFEFTIKAPQFITHPATSPTYRRSRHLGQLDYEKLGNFQPSREVFSFFEKTKHYARLLESKIIIFQSPPSFAPSEENLKNMERFFSEIDREKLLLGWEARGKWKKEEIKEVCSRFDLVDVVDPFLREPEAGRIRYFRLHGGKNYRHRYTDGELTQLAHRLTNAKGYVMFNNLNMFEDGQRFSTMIRQGIST